MPALFEIPLSPSPQRFSVNLTGVTYQLTFYYRDAPMGGWSMDIADNGGFPIACGLPLVTGADLLAQFEYLGLSGGMVVQSDGDPAATPTFRNLGVQSRLLWISLP